MDDSVSGHRPRAGQRGGRRPGSGPSVLTPPAGMPTVPAGPAGLDVPAEVVVPAQRSAPVTPPALPLPPVVVDPCACGHRKDAHEHYRPGTDCGACGATACAAFRPAGSTSPLRKLFRRR
jgi:hypothetical protein